MGETFMILTVIESPYAGDVEANVAYAKRCVLDCLQHGEAPYASHLFFTQPGLLNDLDAEERRLGIEAGLAWGRAASIVAVYVDRGISSGMMQGIAAASRRGAHIETRALDREVTREDLSAVWKATEPVDEEYTHVDPCEWKEVRWCHCRARRSWRDRCKLHPNADAVCSECVKLSNAPDPNDLVRAMRHVALHERQFINQDWINDLVKEFAEVRAASVEPGFVCRRCGSYVAISVKHLASACTDPSGHCGRDVVGITAFNITLPAEHGCQLRNPWQERAERAEARVAELESVLGAVLARMIPKGSGYVTDSMLSPKVYERARSTLLLTASEDKAPKVDQPRPSEPADSVSETEHRVGALEEVARLVRVRCNEAVPGWAPELRAALAALDEKSEAGR